MKKKFVRIMLLGGDNMLGRGVQLSLPYQVVGEEQITDSMPASYYFLKALHNNTPSIQEISKIREENVEGKRLWNELLDVKILPPPDVRILNLETALTFSIDGDDIPWHKGINYHLNSRNLVPVFSSLAACTHGSESPAPYVVVFSNNHVLDFGRKALEQETLSSLEKLPPPGLSVGVGLNFMEASAASRVETSKGIAIRVIAFATGCSGVPEDWAATKCRSGIVRLPPLTSERFLSRAKEIIADAFDCNDVTPEKELILASIHWGPNWAYRYEDSDHQIFRSRLAHLLIDEFNVDIVYGHSSHHIRGMELYKDKLILYGTGDFINDYEGFANPGDEAFCKLGAIFLIDYDCHLKKLQQIRLIPTFINELQLRIYRHESKLFDPTSLEERLQPEILNNLMNQINHLSVKDSGDGGHPVILQLMQDLDIGTAAQILVFQNANA